MALQGKKKGSTRPKAPQAAALVWRTQPYGLQILLITSLTRRRWVLPKGWREKGETGAQAAHREALEEAGISGMGAQEPAGTYVYDKIRKNGTADPVSVEVYALECRNCADDWPEMRRRRRLWVSPAAASKMVAEEDLARLLLDFQREHE